MRHAAAPRGPVSAIAVVMATAACFDGKTPSPDLVARPKAREARLTPKTAPDHRGWVRTARTGRNERSAMPLTSTEKNASGPRLAPPAFSEEIRPSMLKEVRERAVQKILMIVHG